MRSLKRYSTFDVVNFVILFALGFVVAYPFFYSVSVSISNPVSVSLGKVLLWPIGANLHAYKQVLRSQRIWNAYKNTVIYASLGTAIRLSVLMLTAYPLSRKKFPARNFFMFFIGFTMLFSGGLIPTFLVVRSLGMINTIWAMIIPGLVSAYYVIITRTFFQSTIPESLHESAELDGANDLQVLIRIVLPLSKPILAVMGLFITVAIWNDYFTPLIYLPNDKLQPLTILLRDIVVMAQGREFQEAKELGALPVPPQSVQSATLIISMIPVFLAYPFIQKYFVKGIMIGAIRG